MMQESIVEGGRGVTTALISLLMRHVLAWVLLVSALEKIRNAGNFRQAVSRYPLISDRIVSLVAISVPAVEVALSLLLLSGTAWREAALLAAIVISVFTMALIAALRRGLVGDCGCGGILSSQTVGPTHMLSNGLLVVSCVVLASMRSTSSAIGPDGPWLASDATGISAPAALVIAYSFATVLTLVALRSVVGVREARQSVDLLRSV